MKAFSFFIVSGKPLRCAAGFVLWMSLQFLSLPVEAQYMIAGQHDQGQVWHDFVPDTTLVGTNNYPPWIVEPPTVLGFDLDLDGTEDCQLSSGGTSLKGWGSSSISLLVTDSAHCQVALGSPDTCLNYPPSYFVTQVAACLSEGDTIGPGLHWNSGGLAKLIYYDWGLKTYLCTRNAFADTTQVMYLAIRITGLHDTVYGWIGIKDVHNLTFTVTAYASGQVTGGTSEKDNPPRIFPNPTRDDVNIGPLAGRMQATLTDAAGAVLTERVIGPGMAVIGLGACPAGIYFVRMYSPDGVFAYKIIRY